MSEHRVVLPLRNGGNAPMTVRLEPWGVTRTLAPGAQVFVIAKGPAGGDLEVERGEGAVTVYGWSGCVAGFSTSDPTQQSIAGWFVEQLRKPHDPAADAALAAYEAEKDALTHVWFVRRGRKPPTARTRAEMEFAASLEPCPSCMGRGLGVSTVTGSGTSWELSGECASCGNARSFKYTTEGSPTRVRHRDEELSPRASYLIPAEAFREELDRLLPRIRADARARLRALVCVNELLKLEEPGPDREKKRAELEALVTSAS